jgi:serine/threonine-protein kinase
MSPEQCNGALEIDHRADLYSLGCVLFHLLTGRPLFDLPGVGAIISAHLREPAPVPSSVVGPLPSGIDELVMRCLAKSPADRFATALELQQACDAILAQITATPASVSISAPVPRISQLPHTPPPYDPPHTTLGDAAGQPPVTVARSRIGLWIALAALAGGTGAAAAVLTSRGGAHRAATALPAATEPPVPEPRPVEPPPAVAAVPALPSDAGATDAAEAVLEPGRTPPSVILRKPAPAKKATKVSPGKPAAEDLYDDRN